MSPKATENDEAVDISSTGTLLTLDVDKNTQLGWQIDGTAAADYAFEIRVGYSGPWFTIETYSQTTRVDDGDIGAPEARQARIRCTSAAGAGETANVGIGSAP